MRIAILRRGILLGNHAEWNVYGSASGYYPWGRSGFWRWAAEEKERTLCFSPEMAIRCAAFDVDESGIEKPEGWRISIRRILISSVRLRDFRLDEDSFDIIYSSGYSIAAYCRELAGWNYGKLPVTLQLPAACITVNVFVEKPFIPEPLGLGPQCVLPGTGHRGNCLHLF